MRDPAGAAVLIGAAVTFDSSHVNANGNVSVTAVDTPPAGAVLKYSLNVTNGTAGTVSVTTADSCSVTVEPLA